LDAAIQSHGSCGHHFGLDISFHKYKYHDSLQASLIEGIGHSIAGCQWLGNYFSGNFLRELVVTAN